MAGAAHAARRGRRGAHRGLRRNRTPVSRKRCGRRSRNRLRVGDLRVGAAPLDHGREALRPLRPRRGTRDALDRGRGDECLSPHHCRRAGLLRHVVARRPLAARSGKALDVLAARVARCDLLANGDALACAAASCIRSEHSRGRRRRGRSVDRPEAAPTSGVPNPSRRVR